MGLRLQQHDLIVKSGLFLLSCLPFLFVSMVTTDMIAGLEKSLLFHESVNPVYCNHICIPRTKSNEGFSIIDSQSTTETKIVSRF